MSATTTGIAWTDRTWNAIRGCSLVSSGCTNCYAMRQAGRFSGPGQPYEGLVRKTSQGYKWTGEVRLIEKDLDAPLRWKKPQKIFVNSMSDLFHESVPDTWIDQIMAVMWAAQWHTFQVLTKRDERLQSYMADPVTPERIAAAAYELMMQQAPAKGDILTIEDLRADIRLPLPNVWLGVSVENISTLSRLNYLCNTPASVRFASFEPLLEDLGNVIPWLDHIKSAGSIDWCIVGGESGPKARPCSTKWIRNIVQHCAVAEVACFVKQLGAVPTCDMADEWPDDTRWTDVKTHPVTDKPFSLGVRLVDKKGSDSTEWPEDLRVQQFPITHQRIKHDLCSKFLA